MGVLYTVQATSGTGFSRLPCDFFSTFLSQPVLPTTKDSLYLIHGRQPPFLKSFDRFFKDTVYAKKAKAIKKCF
jgi:hypothetical protein